MGFAAQSRDEAEVEAENAKEVGEYEEDSELIYAKHCPYCGSENIEAI
jgi:predicted Zn-ribbon and HTH transcriptional regulator